MTAGPRSSDHDTTFHDMDGNDSHRNLFVWHLPPLLCTMFLAFSLFPASLLQRQATADGISTEHDVYCIFYFQLRVQIGYATTLAVVTPAVQPQLLHQSIFPESMIEIVAKLYQVVKYCSQ